MSALASRLFPGDTVEVRSPAEILTTLDSEGALGRLPFMPEMLEYCGRRFRVLRRVVKICTSGSGSSMRSFPGDDVVFLENLRCSGADHDGCQKGCMIFWREAWLRKVDPASTPLQASAPPNPAEVQQLRARLKTKASPTIYFCQASELFKAAEPLSRPQRFSKCVDDLAAHNTSVAQLARRIAVWVFWRARRIFLGPYGRGTKDSTPAECLALQPGELVEVKPMSSIVETLNPGAYNRGLWFSPDMRLLCGRERKVTQRIDKIIVDGTGEMRRLRNTVYLEGSMCGCAHVAFGGCSRNEFVYWREVWLKRKGAAAKETEDVTTAAAASSRPARDLSTS